MNNLCRKESDIFSDLEKVCTSPGYIHAIAYLDFKNFWTDFTSNDLSEKSITDKLTRTEISILIGLLCKKAIRTIVPHPPLLQTYINRTEDLLTLNRDYEVIYPFCIISDHYPSLALQVKMFLKYQETENIKAPFVMDIFLLDVATEMLQSPLDFLGYIKKRVNYGRHFSVERELTLLAYYLKYSDFKQDADLMKMLNSTIFISEDLCVPELTIAMLNRRDKLSGISFPSMGGGMPDMNHFGAERNRPGLQLPKGRNAQRKKKKKKGFGNL